MAQEQYMFYTQPTAISPPMLKEKLESAVSSTTTVWPSLRAWLLNEFFRFLTRAKHGMFNSFMFSEHLAGTLADVRYLSENDIVTQNFPTACMKDILSDLVTDIFFHR